jgi:hypothetical protein
MRHIHEKSEIIQIKQSTPEKRSSGEHGLKQHFFDPSKSSPPNEFMLKLYMRVNMYQVEERKNESLEME